MTPQLIVASLLAMAVVTGWTRLLLAWRRDRAGERTWRRIALLLAQPAMAALLYLVLYPPPQGGGAGGVPTVLAEAADAGALADAPGPVFALPEAPAIAGVERVPDLATVLRRHPGTRRVRVAGAGLTARDLDAALGIAIEPVLTDLPPGVWRVHVSSPVVAGATLRISGQAGGVPGGQVELRDPAGRRVDAMALPDDGAFSLSAGVHAPGTATFVLRVLDADGGVVESAPVATHAEAPLAPRVLLLSGAPNPETRALSRWMHDAGFAVQSRIALGGGAAIASGSAEVDDPRLDLLVVDARAWQALGEGGRARALAAVEAGMGLLLRADVALPAAALRPLSGKEFALAGGTGTTAFALAPPRLADEAALRARLGTGTRDAPVDVGAAAGTPPQLARRDLRATGASAVPLLRDAQGDAVAWWRPHGQGRIGVWTPVDTWLLPLAGRRDLHAELWNTAFAALARPRPRADIRIDGQPRAGERVAVCGVGADATVSAPDGVRTRLLPDPDAGGCAAFWPAAGGWHRVEDGESGLAFHVLAPDALPGVRLAAMREATLRLAAKGPVDGDPGVALVAPRRMPSWPWFLAWLLLATAAWWLERARAGRAVPGRDRA
jgi:hypothetical protein